MNKKKIVVLLSLVSLLPLSSCLENPFAGSIINYSSQQENISVTTKTSFADNKTDPFTNGTSYFKDIVSATGRYSPKTTGNIRLLVVPVVFQEDQSTYTSSSSTGKKVLADLNTTFFGTSSTTNYWESVSSFYDKSSYGKLNITGTVTDFVYTSKTLAYYSLLLSSKRVSSSTVITDGLAEGIYDNLFTGTSPKYKVSDYDGDQDGVIDLFWMVYMSPYSTSSDLLWAYTYWDSSSSYNSLSNYSWASYSFMYEGVATGSNAVDAHTFIHESGHQMGLDDYYSYDSSVNSTAHRYSRAPLGGNDMMDYNIVDHCSFSKYCLGWVTPTIGEKDHTYTLKPFAESGDCLILAKDFNGTCFDEYFIAEYYTPTNLNLLDSTIKYATSNVKGFSEAGIRILHVDQRLGKVSYNRTLGGWAWDGHYYDNVQPLVSSSSEYTIISSNTKEYCYDSSSYALVSLVQASGNTNLMQEKDNRTNHAVNADLFTPLSKVFGKDVFPNGTKADEGWSLDFYLSVDALTTAGATLTIH
ncbi:MAG: hypothetical protein LKJ88_00675 [Bacilli bacterium]|jgi:M6 family metalloprotease-like protein|nr:hypothetical protein [Bacilli bacterium]